MKVSEARTSASEDSSGPGKNLHPMNHGELLWDPCYSVVP